jgi:hypothetical protein
MIVEDLIIWIINDCPWVISIIMAILASLIAIFIMRITWTA